MRLPWIPAAITGSAGSPGGNHTASNRIGRCPGFHVGHSPFLKVFYITETALKPGRLHKFRGDSYPRYRSGFLLRSAVSRTMVRRDSGLANRSAKYTTRFGARVMCGKSVGFRVVPEHRTAIELLEIVTSMSYERDTHGRRSI